MSNKKAINPHPKIGDLVRIINAKDTLVKDGAIGIIEGYPLNGAMKENVVCFNFSVFIGESSAHYVKNEESGKFVRTPRPCTVSASGGPGYFIEAKRLTATGERMEHAAWNWRDGHPRADNARHYRRMATVWLLDASYFRGMWP